MSNINQIQIANPYFKTNILFYATRLCFVYS